MRKSLLIWFAVILCLNCLKGQMNPEEDKEKINRIKSFIQKAMKSTNTVPGLGVAIVRDDRIIYADGFGLRDVKNQLPVTSETGFYIASTTKPLVCLAAAQLENKGAVDLNTPISHYFPDWHFPETINLSTVDLVDMMCHTHPIHNSGLQYKIAFISEPDPEDFTRIFYDFTVPREREFQYSNTSINVTAAVLEKITGKNWREIVSEEVFGPIGMVNTTSFMSRATLREYAYPYIYLDSEFIELPVKIDGQMGSAGGTVTTPADMAKWVIANLNEGMVDGKQTIPAAVIKRVQENYTQLEASYYKYNRFGYGLGLYHADYEGDLLMHHFGGFNGYMAHASFMPEHKIGVVALANTADFGGNLPHLVAAFVYDVLLEKEGLEAKYEQELEEWMEGVRKSQETAASRLEMKGQLLTLAESNPDQWIFDPGEYAGTYSNPRIGNIEVYEGSGQKLMGRYGPNEAQLLPLKKDAFIVDWQVTGYITPPIQLDVMYNSQGDVAGFSYGGREYRKLPPGTSSGTLNEVYTLLRDSLHYFATANIGDVSGQVIALLQRKYPTGAITEPYINTLGYRYLQANQYDMAIALFRFNTMMYPVSSNAYDSLAETYMKSGKNELAEKNYQKSLELDPGNENAKKMLQVLSEQN